MDGCGNKPSNKKINVEVFSEKKNLNKTSSGIKSHNPWWKLLLWTTNNGKNCIELNGGISQCDSAVFFFFLYFWWCFRSETWIPYVFCLMPLFDVHVCIFPFLLILTWSSLKKKKISSLGLFCKYLTLENCFTSTQKLTAQLSVGDAQSGALWLKSPVLLQQQHLQWFGRILKNKTKTKVERRVWIHYFRFNHFILTHFFLPALNRFQTPWSWGYWGDQRANF